MSKTTSGTVAEESRGPDFVGGIILTLDGDSLAYFERLLWTFAVI
jgi:hypothetical protein